MDLTEKADHYRPARDTHALPPDHICQSYWRYNRTKTTEIDADLEVVDFRRGLTAEQGVKIRPKTTIPASIIAAACNGFQAASNQHPSTPPPSNIVPDPCIIYEHADLPGLLIYTQLLPPETQLLLLSQIMHRGLANPDHKTNINADYDVPYPSVTPTVSDDGDPQYSTPSFFASPRNSPKEMLRPKDPASALKPLDMAQYLQKKLRWLTIGDQYDWPTRLYSGKDSTSFPTDIAALVRGLFPGLNAQSGVVLLYSSKDFMPVHRDVSEQCERGLASFSLGCDGLFIIARDTVEGAAETEEQKPIVIRVRSGDVVQMSGEARWAWHAMPKVISGTCPSFMQSWPAGSEISMGYRGQSKAFERWKGFMAGKRLNLSCREVWG